MELSTDLFEKLRRCGEGAPEWQELYDDFVGRLVTLEMGRSAPEVGSEFPAIVLPDYLGRFVTLADLHERRPLVISFNRGSWCPYCRHELESWRDALPALHAAGGELAVIVGEVAGRAEEIAATIEGDVAVLCDVDHGAALELGLAFHAGHELLQRYQDCGLNLADIYGSGSGLLPIPATFVIDIGGIVRFAFVNPDFRVRAEPRDVIAAVASLSG